MIKLKEFQITAAATIAQRYSFYANHEFRPQRGKVPRPFFQALSAITGAGKTPILAQTLTDLRALVEHEPIVFWISKSRSVVSQTFANFTESGKYKDIIDNFKVITVNELSPMLISDASAPLMILATTGTFSQEAQAEGSLNIYKDSEDKFGRTSAWERLKERLHGDGRRPLFIVYDEGHNFTDLQANILKQLEPDAYFIASATPQLPEIFEREVIRPMQTWFEEVKAENPEKFIELDACEPSTSLLSVQRFITTSVPSNKVVEAQLVKRAIQFDGSTAAMEQSLDDLHTRLSTINEEISSRGLNFLPKAIYVCNTNMVDGEADDHTAFFTQRRAAPIRIWRYLVEQKKVDPKKIAVYANLKFADGNKPQEFNLFSKKESDFDDFTQGNFQHIIFNQALQEGWDDPACYLAYIDKSMGSSVQVEQIIGRVLRQYGAKHYDNANLNSAHFFLRVDNENVFTKAIQGVKKKLEEQGAPIEIVDNFGGSVNSTKEIYPKESALVVLHKVRANADDACLAIKELLDAFPIVVEGDGNTLAPAKIGRQQVDLTKLKAVLEGPQWTVKGNTNPVRLRWLLSTALRGRSASALAVTDLQPAKFDVRVQMHSIASKLAEDAAKNIVSAYFQHSTLVYESFDQPFIFGALRVPVNAKTYANGLYEQYGKMNSFEQDFADELDTTGEVWHRNPSAGGFHIPLLTEGDTGAFYPDFIVWKKGKVFCLDTKGRHLLTDAVARKLFDIFDEDRIKLHVRFITEGNQQAIGAKAIACGYTVWKMKNGVSTPIICKSLAAAVAECLK